ncbi:MAG: DUF4097 family beta strand repeat protein [Bacteroidetes bacterium]|jgi:hypothetical protein|nr:DUF4097 family beta strand repeat protein [Bacteroidota bacterium]
MLKRITLTFIISMTLAVANLFSQSTDEFFLDQTYAIDFEGTIHLQSDDAEVQIIGSDREDVRVNVNYELTVRGITFGESNDFEMIVEEDDGNMTIREKDRDFGASGMIGVSSEEYTIEIEAPRDVNLDIEGDDEKYEIAGIDGFIHLHADDSDAQISDVNGEDYSFSLDDGSLEMDGGNGQLKIDTDDGDIQIRNGSFAFIEASSDDSDIEITTPLFDDGDYRFDLDDADLMLNVVAGGGEIDIRHDDSDISTSPQFESIRHEDERSIYRLQGGTASVNIRSDDGDINLRVY